MIGVCVKWVSARREPGDERFAGISLADQAALEMALRQAEATGDTVTVVSVGPAAAERALRDALACGAAEAVRVDAAGDLDSHHVAALLASVVGGAPVVWCGDYSADRGTGSVPAFLAAFLDARQVLGAVAVELDGTRVRATRRLDGGRRELLLADPPAIVSVEGSVARLRRASLARVMAARTAPVRVVAAEHLPERQPPVVTPYRPRARALAAPQGAVLDRLRQLTEADAVPARGETVHLAPPAAASRIVAALAEWGYLPDPAGTVRP